jgi:hypothetical protein
MPIVFSLKPGDVVDVTFEKSINPERETLRYVVEKVEAYNCGIQITRPPEYGLKANAWAYPEHDLIEFISRPAADK